MKLWKRGSLIKKGDGEVEEGEDYCFLKEGSRRFVNLSKSIEGGGRMETRPRLYLISLMMEMISTYLISLSFPITLILNVVTSPLAAPVSVCVFLFSLLRVLNIK